MILLYVLRKRVIRTFRQAPVRLLIKKYAKYLRYIRKSELGESYQKVLALNEAKNRSRNINDTAQKILAILATQNSKFEVHGLCTFITARFIIVSDKDGGLSVRETLFSLSPAEGLIYCRKDATLKAVQLEALVRVHRVRMQHP